VFKGKKKNQKRSHQKNNQEREGRLSDKNYKDLAFRVRVVGKGSHGNLAGWRKGNLGGEVVVQGAEKVI